MGCQEWETDIEEEACYSLYPNPQCVCVGICEHHVV